MSLPLPCRRLLTAQEAAQYLGIKSPATLKAHVKIAPVKIGDSVRYDVRDLDRWIDARTKSQPVTADDWLGRLDEDSGEGRQALS